MLRNSSASNVSALPKRTYPTSSEDYELLDVVGQGVSAKVYRALCRTFNEIVAVKTIELEGIHSNLQEIMREAKTMRLAQHANLLSLHCSFVTQENVLWMVMPYVGGGSVLSIMKWSYRDGLEESWIASILCEVLKSLAYMHKNKFIHRDVKAGNILIDLDGSVKLGDFGVAATMERSGSWGKAGNVRQTFVGTPCWMAPEVMEQIEGYDWHADIWSFGITMLEMVHGHAPFAKYPPMKVLLMTLQNEPPKLEESYKQRHFSKAMREVVQLCLQKDPKQRPTAAKLLEHRLFKNAHHEKDFLVKHLLKSLPSLVERVHTLSNTIHTTHVSNKSTTKNGDGEDVSKLTAQQELETKSQDAYVKGVSMWDFDVASLKEDAKAETLKESGKMTADSSSTDNMNMNMNMNVNSSSNSGNKEPSAVSSLSAIKTTSTGGGNAVPVQVTSPLSIKQKTPAAHKGRFKINLDDDDDNLMNSPPNSSSAVQTSVQAAEMKRRMSRTSMSLEPNHKSMNATRPSGAASGVEQEPSLKKKEQRGRFVISGEDDDEKEELQVQVNNRASESKPPKRPQEQSLQNKQSSLVVSKLDPSISSDRETSPLVVDAGNNNNNGSSKLGGKDHFASRGGGTSEASISPQVLQYLQGMQMNLQHQQDTLNYLLSGSGVSSSGLRSGPQMHGPSSHHMSPRPHSLNDSGQHHAALLKSLESATLSVKSLCDENDKLKKRNLHLERELTKCQNKLLELQEAKEIEEEEEQMAQIERVSSEVISDRDHARHLANANRSLSDKSLKGQAEQ